MEKSPGNTAERYTMSHCEVYGGRFDFYLDGLRLTNCLFHRTGLLLDDSSFGVPYSVELRNNLFRGGELTYYHYETPAWSFVDNLFDDTSIVPDGYVTNSYNAYTTNVTRLTPNGTGDIVLSATNFTYDTGPLGRFYLPSGSSLINAGSTWATNVGLYHFVTTANQTKEAASQVDISFHYAALTGSSPGSPATDYESDSYFDYAEDLNGNGSFDSGAGETDWTAYNSRLGIGTGPGLVVFTPLK
jgi:hypothetical protein